jgi:cobalt-zinc-cadmium efflux system membrane fusion protein
VIRTKRPMSSARARHERAKRVPGDLGRPFPRAADAGDHPPFGRDHVAVRQHERAEGPRRIPPLVDRHLPGNVSSQHPPHGGGRIARRDRDHRDVGISGERASRFKEATQLAATRAAPRPPQVQQHEAPPQRAKRDHDAIRTREANVGSLLAIRNPRDFEAAAAGASTARGPEVRHEGHQLRHGQHNHREDSTTTQTAHDHRTRDRRFARRSPWREFARLDLIGNRVLALWIVALAVLLQACRREPAATQSPPRDTRQAATPTFHGGPAAHPGDWCGGHGVPESECTRCNPELIPQFRARTDWCAEHAIPESQCTICHPDLLRQGVAPTPPPAAVPPASADGAISEAPLAPVRLASPAVAAQVGIETVTAARRPMAEELIVPVRIALDPGRIARVSARADGLVRAVHAELGALVRAGDRVVTLESPAAAAARAELAAARVRLANAARAHARATRSAEERIGSQSDLERAHNELAAARADLRAHEAASAITGPGGGALVHLRAPREGILIARSAVVGQQARAEEALFELADLSSVWGILDVPDADAPRLREGLAVTVEIDGHEGTMSAVLAWIAPSVDPRTRTVQARIALPNDGRRLRANAFGRARIAVAPERVGVVVPRDALHAVHGREVVFVQRSSVLFEPRAVQVTVRGPGEALLADGSLAGERVVTTGGFQLKTELLRDAIGAGCCDDEG